MEGMATATKTAPATKAAPKTVDQRIERLSTASLNRILEPDVDVPGEVGDGQVLPDELLSIADLPELLAGAVTSALAMAILQFQAPAPVLVKLKLSTCAVPRES